MSESSERYRVLKRISAGGMAEVFLAESQGIHGFSKRVAIKRVLPHLAARDKFIHMFLDEARLCARLTHSNVVQTFDIGFGNDTYFIVMEFVDGADLRTVLDYLIDSRRTLPVEEAVFIAIELCKGLAYAHELTDEEGNPLSIVHRDVSPPNVLLTKYGEVKIVDFGLAKANTQLEKSEPGIIKGKYAYLAPEALEDAPLDGRADIFALGAMLWEMLAGRKLFQGRSELETIRLVRDAKVLPITSLRPDVPKELEPILAKALACNRDERYHSGREFGVALQSFLHGYTSRPVNCFELCEIVRDAVRRRASNKDENTSSSMERYIEDVDRLLFSFESIGTNFRQVGATPLDLSSFSITAPKPRSQPVTEQFQVNHSSLADLEEIEPSVVPGGKRVSLPPQVAQTQVVIVRAPAGKLVAIALIGLLLGGVVAFAALKVAG